jgi:hypothetical protein
MTTFNELRKLARDKRDTAIKQAREDYQGTLAEVNYLEKLLIEPKPSLRGRPKPTTPLRVEIMEVAPKDSVFTVRDILQRLEFDDSEFARVRTTFDRLIKLGDIKRVRRGRRNIPAVFAVSTYGPPTNELNDLSQVDAAELVLRRIGRPVDLTLLIVEMIERGYEPVNGKMGFKKSLRSALGRSDKFVENDGHWMAAAHLSDGG